MTTPDSTVPTDQDTIPPDQDTWLPQVRQEWSGAGVQLQEMETGIVRLCLNDECYSADPGQVNVEDLARALETLGLLSHLPEATPEQEIG